MDQVLQNYVQCHIYENTQEWSQHLSNTQGLNIVHLNIRSMRKNFNELLVMINSCYEHLDLIILSEINIRYEELPLYKIDGYEIHSMTRENRRGGGIVIYAKININFSANYLRRGSMELIHGIVGTKNSLPSEIHILAVYRPPETDKILFKQELKDIIKIIPKSCDIVLIGDTNINLKKVSTSYAVMQYENMLHECGLVCAIRDNTREEVLNGRSVASCIDHLWIRTKRRPTSAHVHKCKLSDHYMIGATLPLSAYAERRPTNSESYVLSNKLVRDALDAFNWSELNNINCPIELYEKLHCIFGNIYDMSRYQRSVYNKKRTSKPWITIKLINMIKYRDNLFKKWKASPNNMNYRLMYTTYRNKVNKSINAAKNAHRKIEFAECNTNIRKMWECINNWLGRKTNSLDSVILKYLGQTSCTEYICDQFTKTFSEEIQNIKHQCNVKFLDRSTYVTPSNVSIRYKNITPNEVEKIITALHVNKAPGADKIRVMDVKHIKKTLSPLIANFINMCVHKGVYPDMLKLSLIRPIYKQGSHYDYTNYRPIAILSVINKITEKIVVSQVSTFLENYNILSSAQHGFRPGRNTSTALTRFVDDVNNSLNEKKHVVVVFIDFKKAFDTLDFNQLIQAMDECGIRGPLKKWFQAYLTNRKIKTVVDGIEGETADVLSGVPTGSVLGPLSYVMHVNAMSNVVKKCHIYMYADDTCLLYADKDVHYIEKLIQSDLLNIIKWSHDNGIIININKTKCMHIHSPYSRIKCNTVAIVGHDYSCLHNNLLNCNCSSIEVVDRYRYLGLTVDTNLSWKYHISNVCASLRSVLGQFYHLKGLVSKGTLYIIYYALVESLVTYGLSTYGRTFKTNLNKIKEIQIRFLKFLVNTYEKNRCKGDYDKLFKVCEILPVHYKFKLLLLVEHAHDEGLRERIQGKVVTRKISDRKLVVPSKNNYFGGWTTKFLVPTLLNELPVDFRDMRVSTHVPLNSNSNKLYKRFFKEKLKDVYAKQL